MSVSGRLRGIGKMVSEWALATHRQRLSRRDLKCTCALILPASNAKRSGFGCSWWTAGPTIETFDLVAPMRRGFLIPRRVRAGLVRREGHLHGRAVPVYLASTRR